MKICASCGDNIYADDQMVHVQYGKLHSGRYKNDYFCQDCVKSGNVAIRNI